MTDLAQHRDTHKPRIHILDGRCQAVASQHVSHFLFLEPIAVPLRPQFLVRVAMAFWKAFLLFTLALPELAKKCIGVHFLRAGAHRGHSTWDVCRSGRSPR